MKKRNRRKIAIGTLAIFCALTLSVYGCSDNSSKQKENTEPSYSVETSVEKEASSKVESSKAESSKTESSKAESSEESSEAESSSSEESTESVEKSESATVGEDGLRTEFKEAMDSYESFMNEYCEFMKKYNENPSDLSLLSDYATFMSEYADFTEKFNAWDNDDMNDAELTYYLEVQARVTANLSEVAQ